LIVTGRSFDQNITTHPLTWPEGWKRTPAADRTWSRFGKKRESGWGMNQISVAVAVDTAMDELRMMGFGDWQCILSTNLILRLDGLPRSDQRDPQDPGASLWWRNDQDEQFRVIAIDRYARVADNIYAIGKTLEAMRGIERWGGGEILERTFTGFVALPSPESAGGLDPHVVIGAKPSDTYDSKVLSYKKALSAAHPDKGGSSERFHSVREAGRMLGLGVQS
jgi:hypothetical protein